MTRITSVALCALMLSVGGTLTAKADATVDASPASIKERRIALAIKETFSKYSLGEEVVAMPRFFNDLYKQIASNPNLSADKKAALKKDVDADVMRWVDVVRSEECRLHCGDDEATIAQSPSNLRQAIVAAKTTLSSIMISRFARVQDSKAVKPPTIALCKTDCALTSESGAKLTTIQADLPPPMGSSTEFDCEMKINGFDNIGDSKRKGYEGQIEATSNPSKQEELLAFIETLPAHPSNLSASLGAKIGGANSASLPPAPYDTSAPTSQPNGLGGSPIVTSYNRLTGEVNASTAPTEDGAPDGSPIVTSYNRLTGEVNASTAPTEDGTLDGSPIVTSYNRLTGVVNDATDPNGSQQTKDSVPSPRPRPLPAHHH